MFHPAVRKKSLGMAAVKLSKGREMPNKNHIFVQKRPHTPQKQLNLRRRRPKTHFCVIIKALFSSQHLKEFFKTAFKSHLRDNL